MNEKQTTQKTAGSAATKKKKRKMSGLTILFLLAVLSVCFASIYIYTLFVNAKSPLFVDVLDVELPDFTNQAYSQIAANKDYGFKFVVEEQYRSDVAAGMIYDQSPKPPKTVKENATVTLRVSKGTKYVTVPDVYGKTREEAQAALQELDLHILFEFIVDPTVDPAQVVKISPQPGSQIATGETITIGISAEKIEPNVEVPDLTGVVGLAEVNKILADNRLVLGEYIYSPNPAPYDTVVYQFLAPGTKVMIGTKVDLIFSYGWVEAPVVDEENITLE